MRCRMPPWVDVERLAVEGQGHEDRQRHHPAKHPLSTRRLIELSKISPPRSVLDDPHRSELEFANLQPAEDVENAG
jgi:hypothetical protein